MVSRFTALGPNHTIPSPPQIPPAGSIFPFNFLTPSSPTLFSINYFYLHFFIFLISLAVLCFYISRWSPCSTIPILFFHSQQTQTPTQIWTHTTHAHTNGRTQSDLPPLTHITKIYFKIIQSVHHRNIMTHAITTNTPPMGMYRQVRKLAQFIKLACPNKTTSDRVQQSTDIWLKQTWSF